MSDPDFDRRLVSACRAAFSEAEPLVVFMPEEKNKKSRNLECPQILAVTLMICHSRRSPDASIRVKPDIRPSLRPEQHLMLLHPSKFPLAILV
jgi:hypothetical protein